MAKSISTQNPSTDIVFSAGGVPKTTSLIVAEKFGKRHDNVVRAIQNLDCSPKFNALNFEAVEYTDAKGEKRPAYEMTRDGFTFLAMGFTGKEAAQWKEAYIDAFNRMESALIGHQAKAPAPPAQPTVTLPQAQYDAINSGLDEVMHLFHPHSQPFIHLLGVKRALAGRCPKTSLPEDRFVVVRSASPQPRG